MGRLTPMASRVRFPEPAPHPVTTDMRHTRRSAMSQSRTLDVGMDGHKASMAVASVAHAHGADVVALGPAETRQGALDTLSRPLQSKSTQRVFVSEAGPLRLLARSLTHTGAGCGV